VGSLTSLNPIGLHGPLRGQLYFFTLIIIIIIIFDVAAKPVNSLLVAVDIAVAAAAVWCV
jgi:hypothetical protein